MGFIVQAMVRVMAFNSYGQSIHSELRVTLGYRTDGFAQGAPDQGNTRHCAGLLDDSADIGERETTGRCW